VSKSNGKIVDGSVVEYEPKRPSFHDKPLTPLMMDRAKRVLSELTTGREETYSGAYRKVVDCSKKNDNTVRNEVSKLLKHPDVTALLEASKSRIDFNKARQKIFTAKLVHERLLWEADPDNNESASVRVKALELLGRDSGMFVGVAASEDPRSYEQALAELQHLIGDDSDELVTHEADSLIESGEC